MFWLDWQIYSLQFTVYWNNQLIFCRVSLVLGKDILLDRSGYLASDDTEPPIPPISVVNTLDACNHFIIAKLEIDRRVVVMQSLPC